MVRNVNPYRQNAGYVRHMPCKLGGDVVVYDRERGFDCAADHRWIVMHEPSSLHVACNSRSLAVHVMLGVALSESFDEARLHADILPPQSEGEDK